MFVKSGNLLINLNHIATIVPVGSVTRLYMTYHNPKTPPIDSSMSIETWEMLLRLHSKVIEPAL